MDTLVITGYPKAGKSTLTEAFSDSMPIIHTDSFQGLGWGPDSEAVSYLFDKPGPWVIEGVTAVRAIRKWLKDNPGEEFPHKVVFLRQCWTDLSPGQRSMCKALDTIWSECIIQVHEIDHSEIVGLMHEDSRRPTA